MKKEILKNVVQYFRDFTIRKKLMLSYFMLIFFPLIIFTIVTYVSVSQGYESQIRYSANQSFDQANRFLSYKVNSLINNSDIIYNDTGVQTILIRSKQVYENNIIQQNIDMMYLNNLIFSFRNSEDVYRVCLYVPGWMMYSNQGINFRNIDNLKDTDTYRKLMLSKNEVLWLQPETLKNEVNSLPDVSVISLLRKIRNKDQIGDSIGIEKISILESNIKDIIMKANITRNGVVYIQNSEGSIICCSNTDMLKKFNLKESISKKLAQENTSWYTMAVGKERFTITLQNIKNTDWTMITAIPYSEILSQSNKIRNLMLVLMLVVGVIAYAVAYIISASTTKRISLLTKEMIKVQEGELNVSISSRSQDEIGQLMNSFNFMVKKFNILVEEQYKNDKEIKNAELKALQSQINPHFLYNTLDLINWKAIDNDVPEITEITQSLAKFYKLSLSNGKDIVSIRDEIKHVITYVKIQNMRFDNQINFILDISEEIYKYSIIKIILQPILENSILHGILENRDKQGGIIKLTGRLENDTILLIVQDDGVGMTKERVAELLMDTGTIKNHGYGVRNINDRIKLCYGQRYGLTYYSSLGEGTLVEVRIPSLKEGDYPLKLV